MKLHSSVLFRLARGLRDFEVAPADGVLQVPAVLSPTIELAGPIRLVGGFDISAVQEDSFVNSATLGRAASQAAATGRVCTFARGLWRISFTLTGLASYTQASDGSAGPAMTLSLEDVDGNFMEPLGIWAVNGIPQVVRSEFAALFDEESWRLVLRVAATGVAQTHVAHAGVMASRLH